MPEIRFTTVIGEDQVIRPPQDVKLPPGEAEVVVRQAESPWKDGIPPTNAGPDHLFDRLASLADNLGLDASELPADLAENHDYYLHGLPKGIDNQ